MGTIKQGILGGFSGKVGYVIGSSWKGILSQLQVVNITEIYSIFDVKYFPKNADHI